MSDVELLRQEIRELRTINIISQKDALTVEEAIIFTGLSKQTIYNMCTKRVIPHYRSKGGKKIYFKKEELTDWMLGMKISTSDTLNAESAKRTFLGNRN